MGICTRPYVTISNINIYVIGAFFHGFATSLEIPLRKEESSRETKTQEVLIIFNTQLYGNERITFSTLSHLQDETVPVGKEIHRVQYCIPTRNNNNSPLRHSMMWELTLLELI